MRRLHNWAPMTPINGWIGTSEVLVARKDSAGNVHIRGATSRNPGIITEVFTLPAGFRPGRQEFVVVPSYIAGIGFGPTVPVLIENTGAVRTYGAWNIGTGFVSTTSGDTTIYFTVTFFAGG